MVVNLLMLNSSPQNDAADALAIAICHSHMRNGLAYPIDQGDAHNDRMVKWRNCR